MLPVVGIVALRALAPVVPALTLIRLLSAVSTGFTLFALAFCPNTCMSGKKVSDKALNLKLLITPTADDTLIFFFQRK